MSNLDFLETPRLTFRCWMAADRPLASSLWQDAEVMRYMGGPMTDAEVDARLSREIGTQERLGFQYWPMFLRETGAFAGCCGLKPFHDEAGVMEMGIHVARPFWGTRLGEEATRAVIAYAFSNLRARALTAAHHPENANSKALLRRLGFVYTHDEIWIRTGQSHPFYRLEPPTHTTT
jgi:ribosomal-protein-alanine N-acetyltransferase